MKTTATFATAGVLLAASLAYAQTRTFNIVGDKLEYRNLATVESVSEFETFTGRTTKVSGTLNFDPAKKTGSGTIEVDVASVDTGIELRNDHMRSPQWLDTAKYPKVRFQTTKVSHVTGDRYRVTGNFTMHGMTKQLTTDATVRFRKNGPETKAAGFDGDVVQLQTSFRVKLSDYGIKIPAQAAGKVSNDVRIDVRAYALAK